MRSHRLPDSDSDAATLALADSDTDAGLDALVVADTLPLSDGEIDAVAETVREYEHGRTTTHPAAYRDIACLQSSPPWLFNRARCGKTSTRMKLS